MLRRNIQPCLETALSDRPVVLLHGARQTGKTTLAKSLAESGKILRYVTLDDPTLLAAAKSDPIGFIAQQSEPDARPSGSIKGPPEGTAIIDEAQLAPELFPALKLAVDHHRRPGRFLLTGSANALFLPKLSESLAGRMEIITLWPLSQGEINETHETFIDRVFDRRFAVPPPPRTHRENLIPKVLAGGYPEIYHRLPARRRAWFESYLTTILQRDVRDLAHIERLSEMPRLLALLASRCGALLNYSDVALGLKWPQSTLKRYLALLETIFLVRTLPAWSTNLGLRLIKSPKLYLSDTGLLAHLTGLTAERIRHDPSLAGPLLENFVVMELTKQASWSETRPSLFHYRTTAGREVDLLLENSAGEIVGLEIKAASSVQSHDFYGLRSLAELLGKKFLRGLVLYRGSETVPFGSNLFAIPLDTMWTDQ